MSKPVSRRRWIGKLFVRKSLSQAGSQTTASTTLPSTQPSSSAASTSTPTINTSATSAPTIDISPTSAPTVNASATSAPIANTSSVRASDALLREDEATQVLPGRGLFSRSFTFEDCTMHSFYYEELYPVLASRIYKLLESKMPVEQRHFTADICELGSAPENMLPTLSINCCNEVVCGHITKLCGDLPMLQDFLHQNNIEFEVVANLEPARFARFTATKEYSQGHRLPFPQCHLIVPEGSTTLCGLRLEVSTATGHSRFFTCGGLLKIDENLVALTSRHPFDLSDIETRIQSVHLPSTTTTRIVATPLIAEALLETSELEFSHDWQLLQLPPALLSSDVAMNSTNGEYIRGISAEQIEPSGLVSVLANSDVIYGDLAMLPTAVSLNGKLFTVRLIRLRGKGSLPDGSSGAWVIQTTAQGPLLCGFIIGAQDTTNSAFMIPIRDTFRNIKKVLGVRNIRVATEDDIQSVATHGMAVQSTEQTAFFSSRPTGRRHLLQRLRQRWKSLSGNEKARVGVDPFDTASFQIQLARSNDGLTTSSAMSIPNLDTTTSDLEQTHEDRQSKNTSDSTRAEGVLGATSLPALSFQQVASLNNATDRAGRRSRTQASPSKTNMTHALLPQTVECRLLLTRLGALLPSKEVFPLRWMDGLAAYDEVQRALERQVKTLFDTANIRSYIRSETWSVCADAHVHFTQTRIVELDSEWETLVQQMILRFRSEHDLAFYIQVTVDVSEIVDNPNPSPQIRCQKLLADNMCFNWQSRQYIPRLKLKEIMDLRMITQLFTFGASAQHASRWRPVTSSMFARLRSSLKILATLIWIDLDPGLISHFLRAGLDDCKLPFHRNDLPTTALHGRACELFLEQQYKFLPLAFKNDGETASLHYLQPEAVVPVSCNKETDMLGHGSFGNTLKVLIDPEQCDAELRKVSAFVVKHSQRHLQSFGGISHTDQIGLSSMNKIHHEHLTTLIACWMQDDAIFMMRPYASMNLEQFLDHYPRPTFHKDWILGFLDQLHGICDGLRTIHNLVSPWHDDNSQYLRLGCQGCNHSFTADVKPENILIFENSQQTVGTWRLSDFESMHCKISGASHDPKDNVVTYAAPELSLQKGVNRSADVFALGCVLLEIMIWTLQGEAALKTFRSLGRQIDNSSCFWLINDVPQLKWSVHQAFDNLKAHCEHRGVFKDVVQAAQQMSRLDPNQRPSAAEITNAFDAFRSQAIIDLQDDEFYLLEKFNASKTILPPCENDLTGQEQLKTTMQPLQGVMHFSSSILEARMNQWPNTPVRKPSHHSAGEHNQLRLGSWLLHEEQVEEWTSTTSTLTWSNGKVGSGKSTLRTTVHTQLGWSFTHDTVRDAGKPVYVSVQAMATWKVHLSKLSPPQRKMFLEHSKHDLPEYVRDIERTCQHQGNASKGRRIARLFRPLFMTTNLHTPIAQTMIQADPTSSALILGGIICIVTIMGRYYEAQEKIVDMLAYMEDKLSILLEYGSDIYQNNDLVQAALVEVFGDILDFCIKAWQLFRDTDGQPRSSLKHFSKSLVRSFELQFGPIAKKFEKDLQIFEDRAQLCDRRETKEFRSMQVEVMMHQVVQGTRIGADIALLGQQQMSLAERSIGISQARETKPVEALLRQQEQDRQQDLRMQKIITWIQASSVQFYGDQVMKTQSRLPGSGIWILQNATFQRWKMSGTSDLLWLKGKPGSGKSCLASVVIEDIKKTCDSVENSKRPTNAKTAFAFLYCNARESNKIEPVKLLCSIGEQLCRQLTNPRIEHYLERVYNRHDGNRPIDMAEIQEAIDSLLTTFKETFFVVDGLDELHELGDDQFEGMCRFFRKLTGSRKAGAVVKLMALSRPGNRIINYEFAGCKTITVDDGANKKDIEEFITTKLFWRSPHLKNNTKLLEEIKEEMLLRADGMFLWVDLVVNSLQDGLSPKGLRQKIRGIPQSLDQQYEAMLTIIEGRTSTARDLALKTLLWVTNARRPLKRAELLEALAIEPGMTKLDEDDRIFDDTDFSSYCGDLIVLDPEGCYQLIHSSLREFLMQPSGMLHTKAPSLYAVLQARAEGILGEVCLTYLNFECFNKAPPSSDSELQELIHINPFIEYASMFWGQHVASAHEPHLDELSKAFVTVFHRRNLSMQFLLMPDADDDGEKWYRGPSNPLHILSVFDLVRVTEAMPELLRYAGKPDGWAALPLDYALRFGSRRMCNMLLADLEWSADADVFLRGRYPWMHLAVLNGWSEVVKDFLGVGHPADQMARNGRAPLHVAAIEGFVDILEILISSGANINLADCEGSTPLHLACIFGHQMCLRILLKSGAQISARTQKGRTVLHVTAIEGHLDNLQLLFDDKPVEFRELVDQTDNEAQTPLHYAAANGHTDVVKFLLERGASFEATTESKESPIHTAIICGSSETALAMLELNHTAAQLRGRYGSTALHYVAGNRDHNFSQDELLTALVEAGSDVEATDEDGWRPLHTAASSGNLNFVRCLIDLAPDLELNPLTLSHRTPLFLAAANGFPDFVQYLLDQGVSLDQPKNDEGDLPIHIALWNGYSAIFKKLVTPQNLNDAGWNGCTALYAASARGHVDIVQYLLEHGAEPNLTNTAGITPLAASISLQHAEVALLLLDWEADPHIPDKLGATALHYACREGDLQLVKRLLQAQCDPLHPSHFHSTPFSIALTCPNPEVIDLFIHRNINGWHVTDGGGNTCLHELAAFGSVNRLAKLQHHFGPEDFNKMNAAGMNALGIAAEKGHAELLGLLVELGVPTADAGMYQNGILHDASRAGFTRVVKMLIDLGFDVNEIEFYTHRTPLHAAVIQQRPMTAEILAKAGADVRCKDAFGLTPMDYASRHPMSFRNTTLAVDRCTQPKGAELMPYLKQCVRSMLQKLLATPEPPTAQDMFHRLMALQTLFQTWLEMRSTEAIANAIACYHELSFRESFPTFNWFADCPMCGRDATTGPIYVCKVSSDLLLCELCYHEYEKGDRLPRSKPAAAATLERLETEMAPVRLALEPFVKFGTAFMVLASGLLEIINAFLEQKAEQYDKWSMMSNVQNLFDRHQMPGSRILDHLKAGREAMEEAVANETPEQIPTSPFGDSQTRIDDVVPVGRPIMSRREKTENAFLKLDRELTSIFRDEKPDKEYGCFTCYDHEYIQIPSLGTATKEQKSCLENGRLTKEWVNMRLSELGATTIDADVHPVALSVAQYRLDDQLDSQVNGLDSDPSVSLTRELSDAQMGRRGEESSISDKPETDSAQSADPGGSVNIAAHDSEKPSGERTRDSYGSEEAVKAGHLRDFDNLEKPAADEDVCRRLRKIKELLCVTFSVELLQARTFETIEETDEDESEQSEVLKGVEQLKKHQIACFALEASWRLTQVVLAGDMLEPPLASGLEDVLRDVDVDNVDSKELSVDRERWLSDLHKWYRTVEV